jgi:hypothetical protein
MFGRCGALLGVVREPNRRPDTGSGFARLQLVAVGIGDFYGSLGMMATEKRERMQERIQKHGRQLLDIFPNATEQDPVSLCKKLRRLEAKAAAIGLRMCNGPEWAVDSDREAELDAIRSKLSKLLGNTGKRFVPTFINLDPRGYALKINDRFMTATGWPLYRDWGGYGIIAPDLSND